MQKLTKEFNVKAGETFSIELESNPTTGYHWQFKLRNKANLISSEYIPDVPVAVGSGGKEVFVFKAKETGLIKVEAEYAPNYRGPTCKIDL